MAILAAMLDFSRMGLFYNLTNSTNEMVDPENICLNTKINLLAEIITEIQVVKMQFGGHFEF